MFGLGQRPVEHRVVADQLRPGLGVANQYRRLSHLRLGQQARFDLLRLDTKAAQFDLLIQTPEVVESAIAVPAHLITGAVQPCTRLAQRVGNKALSRQPRTLQIAPRQANATDAQFPRHTHRQRVQFAIEHPAHHVAQWAADGRALAVLKSTLPVGDVDRGLRRAVTVMQLHGG